MKIQHLAEKIADALFTSGEGEKVLHLRQFDGFPEDNGIYCGGWSEKAVVNRVSEILEAGLPRHRSPQEWRELLDAHPEFKPAMLEMFQLVIRQLTAKLPRWIPVAERLPEREDYYLVEGLGGIPVEVRWYDEICGFNTKDGFQVIYWQPLPAPMEVERYDYGPGEIVHADGSTSPCDGLTIIPMEAE